jgi:UDP-N-acetylglucosamine--N-acetylmuramyl-(pentapeptide) pyrophosphoryl-undecaprenol N-acetylglucosamine transferase
VSGRKRRDSTVDRSDQRPSAASPSTWAVIAGGGTAGHVLPAIAVGKALVERGHPASTIHFVGSRRGIEGRLVPEAGFGITLLPGRGVARRLTVDNVGAVAGLLAALARALVLMARLRPSVVISVGGYASVPCVVAATVLRVPLIVAEQNAVPGAANRLGARLARASAVSFDGTDLPRPVVTGNPVGSQTLAVDRGPAGRSAARAALGLAADATVIAVYGGSLGARKINDAVVGLARRWQDRAGLAIRHIVGERDWDALRAVAPEPMPGGLVYQQIRYEDRMDLLFAAADVAVCRAGATTVADLAVVGLPAILVPLPGAPGDHQTANARVLERAGAARIVVDAELTDERLAAELQALLAEPERLGAMGKAARSVARPGAAAAVAALAERHALVRSDKDHPDG